MTTRYVFAALQREKFVEKICFCQCYIPIIVHPTSICWSTPCNTSDTSLFFSYKLSVPTFIFTHCSSALSTCHFSRVLLRSFSFSYSVAPTCHSVNYVQYSSSWPWDTCFVRSWDVLAITGTSFLALFETCVYLPLPEQIRCGMLCPNVLKSICTQFQHHRDLLYRPLLSTSLFHNSTSPHTAWSDLFQSLSERERVPITVRRACAQQAWTKLWRRHMHIQRIGALRKLIEQRLWPDFLSGHSGHCLI